MAVPAGNVPADFYEKGTSQATDAAMQESTIAAGLHEIMAVSASAAATQARLDERTAADYAEREDLLRIEQELIELRAKDARQRIKAGKPAPQTLPQHETNEPDESLSILAPSSFHRPALTAQAAMEQFRKEACRQAASLGLNERRNGHRGGDEDEGRGDSDECFLDLDALG